LFGPVNLVVINFLAANDKNIQAIWQLRQETELGLTEAKMLVDALLEGDDQTVVKIMEGWPKFKLDRANDCLTKSHPGQNSFSSRVNWLNEKEAIRQTSRQFQRSIQGMNRCLCAVDTNQVAVLSLLKKFKSKLAILARP
jgi:hypothetical protein